MSQSYLGDKPGRGIRDIGPLILVTCFFSIASCGHNFQEINVSNNYTFDISVVYGRFEIEGGGEIWPIGYSPGMMVNWDVESLPPNHTAMFRSWPVGGNIADDTEFIFIVVNAESNTVVDHVIIDYRTIVDSSHMIALP